MTKPVFSIGGPLTDANFNVLKMNKSQVQREADKLAKRTIRQGLSRHARGFVFDAGSHYRISICVSTPERAA